MKKTQWYDKSYVSFTLAFLVVTMLFSFFVLQKQSTGSLGIIFIFPALYFLFALFFVYIVRKRVLAFSLTTSEKIDEIFCDCWEPPTDLEEEQLGSKISHQLMRLQMMTQSEKQERQTEQENVQEVISDISHQVRTPITNLVMYQSTLLSGKLSKVKERKFLLAMGKQVNQLDFLMESLIKMSQFEAGIVAISLEDRRIYDTIAQAIGTVYPKAKKKHISIEMNCDSKLKVRHDLKWTTEAVSNLLDNAIKYSPENSTIKIVVEKWKSVTKIDIIDEGNGIPESSYAQIFTRFYREHDVHNEEGVGIGLYLTREILEKQGATIAVSSKVGVGSVFSIYFINTVDE